MSSALSFLQTNKSYIAVWSGDDECVMEASGQPIRVPPADEVSDCGRPGSKYRYPAAIGTDGKPIPGTVVISDVYGRDEDMNEFKKFDADEWLSILHKRNKALLARGLAVVADVKEVEAVRAQGRPKWEDAKVIEWTETVRAELSRQATWEKKGQPAPESSSAKSVKEAIAGLKAYNRKVGTSFSKDDLLGALSVSTPLTFNAHEEKDEEEVDIAKSGRDLFEAAQKAGLFLKKEEITGLLMGDMEVMDQVADKIQAAQVTA